MFEQYGSELLVVEIVPREVIRGGKPVPNFSPRKIEAHCITRERTQRVCLTLPPLRISYAPRDATEASALEEFECDGALRCEGFSDLVEREMRVTVSCGWEVIGGLIILRMQALAMGKNSPVPLALMLVPATQAREAPTLFVALCIPAPHSEGEPTLSRRNTGDADIALRRARDSVRKSIAKK